jgi:hypothetical protein
MNEWLESERFHSGGCTVQHVYGEEGMESVHFYPASASIDIWYRLLIVVNMATDVPK